MSGSQPATALPRHDVRLLAAAVLAWVATASALALKVSASGLFLTAVVALIMSLMCLRLGRQVFALAAAAACVTLTSSSYEAARSEAGNVAELAEQGAIAKVRLVTTSGARKLPAAKFESSPRYAVAATIRHIEARGHDQAVNTPVTLVVPEQLARVPWRSTMRATVRLAPTNRLGQSRAVAVLKSPAPSLETSPVLKRVEQMRERFSRASASLPDDPAGLVPALVVGDTAAVPDELNIDMNRTGMSHLNAVSGSNVTIVLVAVIWCLRRTCVPFRARTVLVLICLAGYVALCHPDPSVIRAAAMGAVGVLGTSAGRKGAACPALGAAILVLIGLSPWLAVSAGFALSALATLGLILFARPWASTLTKLSAGAYGRAWEMLTIPLAAQALCLPILVVLSDGVSLVSIPANVLAEPFVAPATLAGMVVMLLAQVSVTVASVAVWAPGLPAWAISTVAHAGAAVPGGMAPWPSGWTGAILATLLVAGGIFGWRALRYAGWRGLAAVLTIALVPVLAVIPLPGKAAKHDGWQFVACDVGQGDALLVRTGERAGVLVDTGDAEARPDRCLDRYGVDRLEAVILTHFHADHVGALAKVVKRTDAVFVTPVEEGASESQGHGERGMKPWVDQVLAASGRAAQAWPADARLSFGDVDITAMWPRRVIHAGSVQNNASLLLHVSSPRLHALLLGDAEKEAELAVTSQVASLTSQRAVDVVKVAHHGSNNQAASFYRVVKARFAAVSVGRDNDYGHPGKRLLRMLDAAGAVVVRTDQCGDIVFVHDRGGIRPLDAACRG